MAKVVTLFLMIFFELGMTGCGYTLRGSTRPVFESKNIRTLYIAPVQNNSYKSGVDITLFNALRKRWSSGGFVRIVDREDQADAKLYATVTTATSAPGSPVPAEQIFPIGNAPKGVQLATTYVVNLGVAFRLVLSKGEEVLWADALSRQKVFQAVTFLRQFGNTSALINESEFERTLGDLSQAIVVDAEESVHALF